MPLHRLSGLKLNRVDLVPDGSNPDAHIVLFKAKKEANVPAPKKKVAKKTPKADSRKKSQQRGEDEEDDEEEDIALSREDDDDEEDEDEVAKADDDEDDDADEGDEDEEEEEETPRKKSAKKTKPAKKVKKAAASDDDTEEDEDESGDEDVVDAQVMKSLPKAAQTLLAKMATSLSDMRKTARRAEQTALIEKQKRESLEFIEKAKKDIPSLAGTNEEKGALIQALYSDEPVAKKTADAIVKLLKSGDAAIRSMMSETGRRTARTDDESSAVDLLREKRDEIMKADTKLTKEQAFEKACQQNADLFNQYKVEKRRRSVDRDSH